LLADNAAKDEVIQNLRQKIDILGNAPSEDGYSDGLLSPSLTSRIGPELYVNEFSDRLIAFLDAVVNNRVGDISPRAMEMVLRLLKLVEKSGRSVALHSELKHAGRDVSESTDRIISILSRFGYEFDARSGHIKGLPPKMLFATGQIELPKTPSDHRAGKNAVRDVIKCLELREVLGGGE